MIVCQPLSEEKSIRFLLLDDGTDLRLLPSSWGPTRVFITVNKSRTSKSNFLKSFLLINPSIFFDSSSDSALDKLGMFNLKYSWNRKWFCGLRHAVFRTGFEVTKHMSHHQNTIPSLLILTPIHL